MKQCPKCKQSKPLTEFHKDPKMQSGYRSKCKSCIKDDRQLNRNHIKIRDKEYKQKNKEKIKEYLLINKEKIKEQKKHYQANRRKSDTLYKLKHNIRNLILKSIHQHGYTKQSKTHEILGCSYQEFKTHIEQQFTEGMSWDNRHLWHLDHIIPISLGLTEQEILALNHYTNLQPLWAEDNLSKGNNIHWQKCTEKYKH